YAGTVDAIVKMKDGRVLILDHKTASKKKTKSGIKDYNLQVAAYALAYHEMTGTIVDGAQINIIYRTLVGKRKPTRLDRYDVKNLRKESLAFLARLAIFKAEIFNGIAPW
ncbi:MAG: nuclease superfamily, partial [Cyanobacteriota bacterium]